MSRSQLLFVFGAFLVGMSASLAIAADSAAGSVSGVAEADRDRTRVRAMGGVELSFEVSKRSLVATRYCGTVAVVQLKNDIEASLAEKAFVHAAGPDLQSPECEQAARALVIVLSETVERAAVVVTGHKPARRPWYYMTTISAQANSALTDQGGRVEAGSEDCLVVARHLVDQRSLSLQRPFPPNIQTSAMDSHVHCVFTMNDSLTRLREAKSGTSVGGQCETWANASYDVAGNSIKLSSDYLIYQGSPEAAAQMPDFRWFMELKPGAPTARLTLASNLSANKCSISQIVSVGASELR